jgi:threonine dehydrogenase-like Zn-dependent dehydrogenase
MKYGYSCVGTTESGRRVFAFFPHQDRFYVAPEELLGIPDALAFEDAAFLATMETALGIVHDAAPRYGESALVAGLGVVGLLVAEILLASGVRPVIGVERHPLRREAGRRAGCEVLDPADPARLERIRALTGGRGADLAVNVSGSPAGLQLAIDTTVFEGTVVEASWYGERRATLQLGEAFHRGRLRLRSSQVSRIDPALSGRWDKSRRFGTVLDLLAQLRPSRYLTHRFALDRAAEAFALIDQRPGECIQVALEP